MISEKADEAIIVTSGKFTSEAVNFAEGKPIQLVDGPRLLELVNQGQSRVPSSNRPEISASQIPVVPLCPKCSKAMVLRTARRGQYTGSGFWGCENYPKCKGTRAA